MGTIAMAVAGVTCTGISSLITFLLTKRKYTVEVDAQQLKNVDDSFELYKKIMSETLKTQDEKIALLQKENESLRAQVNQLQMQMITLVGNMHGGSVAAAPASASGILKNDKVASKKK